MKRTKVLVIVIAGFLGLQAVSLAAAQERIEGRYRIHMMNDSYVEGDVKELADGSYEVKTRYGIIVTVRRNQVKGVVALESRTASPGESLALERKGGLTSLRREISDEEIEEILEGVTANYDASLRGSSRDAMMEPLPLNEESLEEMRRYMGPNAEVHTTDHFVMLYTSDDDSARKLGQRLEAVWRHNVKFLDRLGVPAYRPEHKLELFYFGTWDEFNTYNLNRGNPLPLGVLGYYSPDWNCSHFFDMENSPFTANYDAVIDDENADYEARRKARNEKRRFVEYHNMTVIQHEVGHHLHFNIGLFPRDAFGGQSVPVWLVEGTTMLFEVPPTKLGASIGALNDTRLYQLRSGFGAHPLSTERWKVFIIDTNDWFRWPLGSSYPLGWAMVNYLYTRHRDGYGEYLRQVFGRDVGYESSETEREQEFFEIFLKGKGKRNRDGTYADLTWEEFINDFYAFLDTLFVRKSGLPPDDQENFDPSVNDPARGGRGGDSLGSDDDADRDPEERSRSRGRSRGGGRRR